jgi:rhodanese-related sulfurtransferase
MKKIFVYILAVSLGFISCKHSNAVYKGKPVGKEANFEDLVRQSQPKTLAEIYYEHGNFINQKQFPPIVTAADVLENGKYWLLIDIRSPEAYEAGHINGAYNVPKEKVLDFLTSVQKAAAYSKVIFICYSGQMASYVTGITRYAGFDNTYVMLYGMAGWNSRFSEILKKGFATRYTDMLAKATDKAEAITTEHSGDEVVHKGIDLSKLPKLPAKLPSMLIKERAQFLLQQARPEFLLKADEFFPEIKKDINSYYSICYLPKPKYYVAHIKGSQQFTPRKDLSLDGRLTEIPVDKPVLIYCKTGHTGGNATAYLNMLGYKAHNLMFGAGSFMYDLWKEKEWMGDIANVINDFPVIEGKKRTNNKVIALTPKKTAAPKAPIKKHKKKEVTGGCG